MKTLKVKVFVEIRADEDDDDQVRQEIKEALEEAIEDDNLEFEIEESDEDDF